MIEIIKKVCFKCNIIKPLDNYYKHKAMADGHLNKCKVCAKLDVKKRADILYACPKELEKERIRSREKYHRLNYKEKCKKWKKNKPWTKSQTYKNLSRKYKTPKGYELHHWNYNMLDEVIIMNRREHRKLHQLIELDLKRLVFKVKADGKYIESKLEHCFFIKQSGFSYVEKELAHTLK
jgi:hypothetical protein